MIDTGQDSGRERPKSVKSTILDCFPAMPSNLAGILKFLFIFKLQ